MATECVFLFLSGMPDCHCHSFTNPTHKPRACPFTALLFVIPELQDKVILDWSLVDLYTLQDAELQQDTRHKSSLAYCKCSCKSRFYAAMTLSHAIPPQRHHRYLISDACSHCPRYFCAART
ncbi:hypothetical protein TRVL_05992 [Trypanosoma vivax]|nr:hypothetical protein TRVL_05992 [Trypanosoma vivax]